MAEIALVRETRLASAQDAIRETPEDIEALNILTYDALLYRDLDSAMEYSGRARQLAPDDPGVLINLAILQMSGHSRMSCVGQNVSVCAVELSICVNATGL